MVWISKKKLDELKRMNEVHYYCENDVKETIEDVKGESPHPTQDSYDTLVEKADKYDDLMSPIRYIGWTNRMQHTPFEKAQEDVIRELNKEKNDAIGVISQLVRHLGLKKYFSKNSGLKYDQLRDDLQVKLEQDQKAEALDRLNSIL